MSYWVWSDSRAAWLRAGLGSGHGLDDPAEVSPNPLFPAWSSLPFLDPAGVRDEGDDIGVHDPAALPVSPTRWSGEDF